MFRERWASCTASSIGHTKQYHSNTGTLCGISDPLSQLQAVGIGNAVGLVMEVMKLTDRSESRLNHLQVGERRNSLDAIRIQLVRKTVHSIPPRPKVVVAMSALNPAANSSLEGMAVSIDKARHQHTVQEIGGVLGWPNLRNPPLMNPQLHALHKLTRHQQPLRSKHEFRACAMMVRHFRILHGKGSYLSW